MSLSDPTSGAGYAFGEKLPSTHMTTIANQQPNALDIINGGTYSNNGDITINPAGGGQTLTLNSGMQLALGTGNNILLADDAAIITHTSAPSIIYNQGLSWLVGSDLGGTRHASAISSDLRPYVNGEGSAWSSSSRTCIRQMYSSAGSVNQPFCWCSADNLIDSATVTAFTVYVNDPNVSSVATVLPSVALFRQKLSDGVLSSLASQPMVSRGGYETITTSSISNATINKRDYRYLILLEGEASTNATTGVEFHCATVTCDVTDINMKH